MTRTFTIGYEASDIQSVVTALRVAGVSSLVDVRWSARSRKRFFNRSHLSLAAESAGMTYTHDRRLGTPPEMLAHARLHDYEFEEYRNFLFSQTGALEDLSDIASAGNIALLCFEAEASDCHRHVVAEELASLIGGTVEHLRP